MAGKDEDATWHLEEMASSATTLRISSSAECPIGGRGLGPGEIVMVHSYFDTNFSDEFEHPRNMVAGIVNADELKLSSQKALKDGMVHFVPYVGMKAWEGSGAELLEQIDAITADLAKIDYPLDGMVAEATDSAVKESMGATSHHNRWQIAIKTRGETAPTTIVGIQWQTGRTAR